MPACRSEFIREIFIIQDTQSRTRNGIPLALFGCAETALIPLPALIRSYVLKDSS
jgi:hypothetical protein